MRHAMNKRSTTRTKRRKSQMKSAFFQQVSYDESSERNTLNQMRSQLKSILNFRQDITIVITIKTGWFLDLFVNIPTRKSSRSSLIMDRCRILHRWTVRFTWVSWKLTSNVDLAHLCMMLTFLAWKSSGWVSCIEKYTYKYISRWCRAKTLAESGLHPAEKISHSPQQADWIEFADIYHQEKSACSSENEGEHFWSDSLRYQEFVGTHEIGNQFKFQFKKSASNADDDVNL